MSNYSGKADLYDHMSIHSDSDNWNEMYEKFKGTKLYKYKPINDCIKMETFDYNTIKQNWTEIKYNSILDIAPYFPYIICLAFCDNTDNNNSTIVLSNESYVDEEERECFEWYLRDAIKYYNKCKRKHIVFNTEDCLNNIMCFRRFNNDAITEIVNRVKQYGKKANIDGIHDHLHNIYREKLRKDIEEYESNKE